METPRPSPSAPAAAPAVQNLRRHGRVRTLDVQCSLGDVVDISASGMRVQGRGKPVLPQGVATNITLATPAGMLSVEVGVAWVRRTGWGGRGFEMGLEFVTITPDVVEGVRSVLRGASIGPADNEQQLNRKVA